MRNNNQTYDSVCVCASFEYAAYELENIGVTHSLEYIDYKMCQRWSKKVIE